MIHRQAMARRREPDPRDPAPLCGGELEPVTGGFWDDVSWTVYLCPSCHAAIAAVEGGAHPWNYVLSEASAIRLGVKVPTPG